MNVPDLLAGAVARFLDRPCVLGDDRAYTFAEVDARADRVAQAFRAAGLSKGDRVALLARSEPEHFELQVAAQRSGLILVPLNFRLARHELEVIIADCEPRLLIHGPGHAQSAADLRHPHTWGIGDSPHG